MSKIENLVKYMRSNFFYFRLLTFIIISGLRFRISSNNYTRWKLQIKLFHSLNHCGHKAHDLYSIKWSTYFFERSEKVRLEYLNSNATPDHNSLRKTFFGPDMVWALGHMTYAMSLRVKLLKLFPDIYPFNHEIIYNHCQNETLLNLWSMHFKIHKVNSDKALEQQASLWPAVENYMAIWTPNGVMNRDKANDIYTRKFEVNCSEAILSINDEIEELGLRYLKKFGFTSADWFVTLHVRSGKWGPGFNTEQQYGRNADIKDYDSAVKYITNSGGWVVRIGEKNAPGITKHPNVIDYTSEEIQDSRVNTFFLACCKFMIGTNSGPVFVPTLFNKPVVMTNWPSAIRNIYLPNSIVVPKLIIGQKGKILTLEELFRKKVGYSEFSLDKNSKYMWLDNSSDDILQSVIEMNSITPRILTCLQDKFDERVRELGTDSIGTISNSFINKYSKQLGLD